MNESENKYVGTELKDGTIRVEGPISSKKANQKTVEAVTKEKLAATQTSSETKGGAILKIIGHILKKEKSQ